MNCTVAVTGGTGHIGNALIELLLTKEYTVRALYHTSKPTTKHKNLTWIQGDINDSTVLLHLIQNTQILVHSAAMISIDDKAPDMLCQINVGGTLSVINACLKVKNIRLIHISSSEVSDYNSKYTSSFETLPTRNKKNLSYEASKAIAEKMILESVSNDQLDAVILRPTAVIGPPDHQPSLLGQTIRNLAKGKVPMITTGGYDMIDVRDLAQTIVNSFTMAKKGQIYLLSGSYCSIKQLAQLANPRKNLIAISTKFLLVLFPLVKAYLNMSKSNLPLTRKSLITLRHSSKEMNSEKARKELNHNCRSIETTISDLLIWFKQNNTVND